MLLTDLIDFLERQYSYLDGMRGADYLLQLRRWLRTLSEDRQIAALLEDMKADSTDLLARFFVHDDALVPRLKELRDELTKKAHDLDDSTLVPPSGFGDPNFSMSLAYFDQIASAPGGGKTYSKSQGDRGDSSRSAVLLRILRAKLERAQHHQQTGDHQFAYTEANLRPDLNEISRLLGDHEADHAHILHEFIGDRLTSAGVSLAQLVFFLEDLNPKPQPWDGDFSTLGPELQRRMAGYGELRDELYLGKKNRAVKNGGSAAVWEGRMRPHVRRIHEDLRMRLGSRRSLLALLHRFKERCEWHDRDRLRLIAKASKRGEDALTAELARWLFDQGLSPLTRPLTGGLQPDLLDPSKLYVEAKRYGRGGGARRHIVQGAHELFDAVHRLRGTAYEVSEAFYVVFREGGPRYVLPEDLRGDGWVTLPVVVDIAPLSETGSRQRDQPILIEAQELEPKAQDSSQRAK